MNCTTTTTADVCTNFPWNYNCNAFADGSQRCDHCAEGWPVVTVILGGRPCCNFCGSPTRSDICGIYVREAKRPHRKIACS